MGLRSGYMTWNRLTRATNQQVVIPTYQHTNKPIDQWINGPINHWTNRLIATDEQNNMPLTFN
jgi:hypothetical protein